VECSKAFSPPACRISQGKLLAAATSQLLAMGPSTALPSLRYGNSAQDDSVC
jgi:hypothetical protein